MKRAFKKEDMEALLYGSLIMGAGGGGSLDGGRKTIEAAFEAGTPTVIDIEDLDNTDGVVVTTSAVGSPASTDQFVAIKDYNRVIDLMEKELDKPLLAYLTNELGAGSTFNAFIQSATTGIPMIDAACNGRAHPLGTMGSMGLSENEDYISLQTAVGGNPAKKHYVEMSTRGTVQQASTLVRQAAIQAGGLVVVARNPVTVDYVKEHAALGVLSQAIEIGNAFLSGKTALEKLEKTAEQLGGTIAFEGEIEDFVLEVKGALDVGSFKVRDGEDLYEMAIWNEYMALDKNGDRFATFPDLLMTFDADSGEPVTSAKLKDGQAIRVLSVPRENVRLGAGMFEKSGYEQIEGILGMDMLPYVTDVIQAK